MTAIIDSDVISKICEKEKEITQKPSAVASGPTAAAQKHEGEQINGKVISDINKGENHVGDGTKVKGGPTSIVQSLLSKSISANVSSQDGNDIPSRGANDRPVSAILDASTVSTILEAEKKITHKTEPVKDGPTAQAQKHIGEPINSSNMHDVTEGEKLVTGKVTVVKGGPTAILQHNMAKCRLTEKAQDRIVEQDKPEAVADNSETKQE